jgi:hypothetical protein
MLTRRFLSDVNAYVFPGCLSALVALHCNLKIVVACFQHFIDF